VDAVATPTAAAPVTEAEWDAERAKARRVALISSAVGFVLVPSLGFPASWLADATASSVGAEIPLTVAWLGVLFVPFTCLMVWANLGQAKRVDEVVAALTRQSAQAAQAASAAAELREAQARRQEFDSRLANALEMADDEAEVIEVIERCFTATVPDSPVELLLADNSRAHLLRMASASPTGNAPGCDVNSPDQCPAARRAQVQRFASSEDLDACPKLRNRPSGPLGAVCVPVSIMGRTVGVLHATGEANVAFPAEEVAELRTLANLAGARIGLLRVMADTQLQAATDSLTGLLNRRSFEQRLTVVRADEPVLTLAMADLDHFKTLNDTYGHETGDRALRVFADALRSTFRTQDLLCRHGGEEFLIALPACTPEVACRALNGLRTRLDAALTVASLPKFTVSIGVVEAAGSDDLPALIARADAALFAAKRGGRDQIVVHDAQGRRNPMNPEPAPRVMLTRD
jgi:diguanylate cyclase (GGDEF)-like protein